MKKLMKMKNKSKKGFTLIEIIVVLVIIAILAAASVPAMLSYVEEARGKAYINEARIGFTAAQTVLVEALASGSVASVDEEGNFLDTDGDPTTFQGFSNILETTSFTNAIRDVDGGTETQPFKFAKVDTSIRRVVGIVYFNGTYLITIDDGGTQAVKGDEPADWDEAFGGGGAGGTTT